MNSSRSSTALSSLEPAADTGLILRFVDAFPSAAAAIKQPRRARSGRRAKAGQGSGSDRSDPDRVLLLQL